MPTHHRTDDLRIKWTKVVLPPVFLEEELPISETASSTVFNARNQVSEILAARDPRLLVIVGPCSIHDPKAAREYAAKLKPIMAELADSLCIVMRVYFEKPRTTIGWKGSYANAISWRIDNRGLTVRLVQKGLECLTRFLSATHTRIR